MHYSIFSLENFLQYKPTMNVGSLTYGKKIRLPHRQAVNTWRLTHRALIGWKCTRLVPVPSIVS